MRRVQLYEVVRTAHLERIEDDPDETVILYRRHRYDFDPLLANRLGARKAGVLGAFRYTASHDIDVLEISEPLVVSAAPWSLAAVAGARWRALRTRGARTDVVTYAIENLDPRHAILPWRARVRRALQGVCVRPLWRLIDRIAFGTSSSADLYDRRFGKARRRPESRTIEALPVAADDVPRERRAPTLVFLGDLSERKGFPLVIRAWELVSQRIPEARLVIMGKGRGEEDARRLAAQDARVEVLVDPPRAAIFDHLAAAKALVLPSQPRPAWREQVGLPIVEALSRGCIIVTTSQTGLAEWLTANGHEVLGTPHDVSELADAIERALGSPTRPAEVLAALPSVDGRLAAGRWLIDGRGAA